MDVGDIARTEFGRKTKILAFLHWKRSCANVSDRIFPGLAYKTFRYSKGLSSLPFTVQRNGPDSNRLPTASTCYNILLLPEYSSKQKLQQFLMTSINNYQGFGLA
jgi:hypothetical protein